LQISIDELIALKAAINEAAKLYNLPPLAATLQLINDLKKHNKIDGLKKELSALYLQKYILDQPAHIESSSSWFSKDAKSRTIAESQLRELTYVFKPTLYVTF